jgi:hypothetical protein
MVNLKPADFNRLRQQSRDFGQFFGRKSEKTCAGPGICGAFGGFPNDSADCRTTTDSHPAMLPRAPEPSKRPGSFRSRAGLFMP